MEWIEWLLSSEFRKFLLDHDLFFPLLFLGRLIGITAVELWRPAREVSYRKVILYDLTVFVVFSSSSFRRRNTSIGISPFAPSCRTRF